MLICPYCQSVNPKHHNFCQACGRSLNHYICHSCDGKVDFDAEYCPQCQTPSGLYWWTIVEPTQRTTTSEINSTSNPAVGTTNQPEPVTTVEGKQAPISLVPDPDLDDPAIEPEPNPWDLPDSLLTSPVNIEPPELFTNITIDELEIDPWDLPPAMSVATSATLPPIDFSSATEIDDLPTTGNTIESDSLVATTHLDRACRYRLLDPVVIQLLKPSDSSQFRVIDRQPFCNSLLEILMEQEPVTLEQTSASRKPEEYRQWQFWNSHGIPKVAQAYIALQVSLPGTIPTIHDGWDDNGKTVTVVEDRSEWALLADRWNDPEIPASQTLYWLDYTLRLWVALEPWQMRQSLLEVANLLLDEDARIGFQRLYPEPLDRQLELADLAKLWRGLFDRSNHPPSVPLAHLLQAIESGELERIEEVRSRLQQIAYELEPKQLSSPLSSSIITDSSSLQDPPTMAISPKFLDLEDAAATHTGRRRDHNEDCFGIVSRIECQDSPKGKKISARGLYILCDGMGGHAGGEIASAMTVDLLRDYFAANWGDSLPDEQTIREGIVAANEAVHEINQKNSAHGSGRMGTTLVLVLVQDQNIAVAHVGDSRCYGITSSLGLIQLTLDHEVGQQQILRGVEPEIAYGRPDSYQLTQAIGPRDRHYIAPEIRFFELQEDTLILLASDGLTDNQLLETHWLTNVAPLLSSNTHLQDGVDRLIDFANEYNGHDNITAIVVRAKMG